MSESDPASAVRAWVLRMSSRYGPKVWDQRDLRWLDWDEALAKSTRGSRVWILGVPAWSPEAAVSAILWEFGNDWPSWAVKAHLVDKEPCEFTDHNWKLVVDEAGTSLVCEDPCEEPRVFCDAAGRYKYPVCQNIPSTDTLRYEVVVSPEWVYHSEEDWWVELTELQTKSFPVESDTEKYMALSSNGEDTGFSTQESGFDSP